MNIFVCPRIELMDDDKSSTRLSNSYIVLGDMYSRSAKTPLKKGTIWMEQCKHFNQNLNHDKSLDIMNN